MSDFFNKIEKIRQQPENIRLRWVWGMTAVAMIIIVILWIASFSAQKSGGNSEDLSSSEISQ